MGLATEFSLKYDCLTILPHLTQEPVFGDRKWISGAGSLGGGSLGGGSLGGDRVTVGSLGGAKMIPYEV